MSAMITPRAAEAMSIWKSCDAVCFDVDSTVIQQEGIDELAAYVGKEKEVAALTRQAMGGSMTFREALRKRLDIIQPRRDQVIDMANDTESFTLTPGIKQLVNKLHHRGVDVYLVSGGFRSLIRPIAEELNIPMDMVYANEILFNNDGMYAGFNQDQPTSAAGGKPKVAELLKKEKMYHNLVFIGDGATDLEASPPADAFIGFGGNVIRDTVRAKAKWYVYSFSDLISALQ